MLFIVWKPSFWQIKSPIILGVTEDGSMIEMRQHPLSPASMFVIVADSTEDEAVISVTDAVCGESIRGHKTKKRPEL